MISSAGPDFITMAYIIFVNPNIMADAGIDHGAAFVATCIAAALGSLLMGFTPTGQWAWRQVWG